MILWYFVHPQHTAIAFYNLKPKCNTDLLVVKISTRNDSTTGTILNSTVEAIKKIENMIAFLDIRFPESDDDLYYRRVVFRHAIDFVKALKGAKTNRFFGILFSALLDTIDFHMQFPLEPVNFFKIMYS